MVLLSCAAPTASDSSTSSSTLAVTLPDGTEIQAELAVTPEKQVRGLMFREALLPNQGMLFVFPDADHRPFWMFQTRVPLDIIWLDEGRRVVEISPDTPPCADPDPQTCPRYGGQALARYVLELAAGQAEARSIDVGDEILF